MVEDQVMILQDHMVDQHLMEVIFFVVLIKNLYSTLAFSLGGGGGGGGGYGGDRGDRSGGGGGGFR